MKRSDRPTRPIVIHTRKWLWIRIPKNASSSCTMWCCEELQLCDTSKPDYWRTRMPTVPLRELRSPTYRDWFSWAIVRNPWDRVASLWSEKCQGKSETNKEWRERNGVPPGRITADQFVAWLVEQPEMCDPHFREQYRFFVDDEGQFNPPKRLYRFDTLAEEFDLFELPRKNYRRQRRRYEELFSPKSVDLIAQRYARDIATFGFAYQQDSQMLRQNT